MKKNLKKPFVLIPLVTVFSALILLFTDLYYRVCIDNSFAGYLLCSFAIVVCFTVLLLAACFIKEPFSKKLTVLVTVIFDVVLAACLCFLPILFRLSYADYEAAQLSVYIIIGLDLAGFILFGVLIGKSLRIRLVAVLCSVILAFSVVSVTLWAVYDSPFTIIETHEWELDAPEYQAKQISRVYNCGVMQADEYHGFSKNKEESFMQVVSRTDKSEFVSYCQTLEREGYVLTSQSDLENISARTYQKEGKLLHVYYNGNDKTARIVTDPSSVSPAQFSYTYTAQAGDTTAIYQYALIYDDDCGKNYEFNGGVERCGMNYIIKLADNKLILVDGGATWQSSDAAVEGFYDLCKELTGQDNFTVACWLCTHGHSDHIDFFNKFLRIYVDNNDANKVHLERFMYNFPSYKETDNDISASAAYTLYRRLEKYAPDALRLKPHTGETFTLGNVKIDILYTHEDAFDPRLNDTTITDFNDTSTVYRFTVDNNRTITILGDINAEAQAVIAKNYTEKTLKTDIIQAAHHGYNNLDKLYPLFDAEYAFFPQGTENALGENIGAYHNYLSVKEYTDEDKIYFIDKFTYGLSIDSQGTITPTEPRPYIGPDVTKGEYYDGSGI